MCSWNGCCYIWRGVSILRIRGPTDRPDKRPDAEGDGNKEGKESEAQKEAEEAEGRHGVFRRASMASAYCHAHFESRASGLIFSAGPIGVPAGLEDGLDPFSDPSPTLAIG